MHPVTRRSLPPEPCVPEAEHPRRPGLADLCQAGAPWAQAAGRARWGKRPTVSQALPPTPWGASRARLAVVALAGRPAQSPPGALLVAQQGPGNAIAPAPGGLAAPGKARTACLNPRSRALTALIDCVP
jgi:hypothetical protein